MRRFNGCHMTHNAGMQKRKPMTTQEKVLLNEIIARSDTFDVLHYKIEIDVTDYVGQQIKAATTVSVAPLMANQDAVRFDLFQLQVDSVKDETGHLTYNHDGNILRVLFSSIPDIGDSTDITVYYHGHPYQDPVWGGFYFESSYMYNLGIGLTTIPPNFGRVWYPCFDSFVERATYEYHVKSAGTYRAHCQGNFLGEVQLAGDTVIRSFDFNQPIPTHLSAIAVANYADYDYVHTGAYGDIDVRLTAKPNQLSSMQGALQHLPEAIDACEYWYGPHAWNRIGYVLTTDGALEIPNNIAYPDYMVSESVSVNDQLLAHELGHQWWGNIITPHNHNDMWLKEGPAEYSGHLLTEWMEGTDEFIRKVKLNHLDVLENAHLEDGGFQPMSPMPDEYIYGTHTYYKGASVMHNLRGYMGDSLFRQAMTAIQNNYAYEDFTPEQFRDALEEESGVALENFFDDHIFSPGFSVFVVDSFEVNGVDGDFLVDLHLQQKLRACPQYYTDVPLDLTLIGENWERAEFQIVASGQFTELSVNNSFVPVMCILNGHNRLNQARMDHEFVISADETLFPVLPFVDFRVNKEIVVDSSLVRVEHIWAAPDQQPLGEGIFEISDVHYWIVDGLWNEGDFFSGKVYYTGQDPEDIDYALYNAGEQNAVLLYRPDAHSAWELCPDFTLGGGVLTNGNGSFEIDTLRQGQYAFANGDITALVDAVPSASKDFQVYPNPADEHITIRGYYAGHETAVFDIISSYGRLVHRSSAVVEGNYSRELHVNELESGHYIVNVWNARGEIIGRETLVIR